MWQPASFPDQQLLHPLPWASNCLHRVSPAVFSAAALHPAMTSTWPGRSALRAAAAARGWDGFRDDLCVGLVLVFAGSKPQQTGTRLSLAVGREEPALQVLFP